MFKSESIELSRSEDIFVIFISLPFRAGSWYDWDTERATSNVERTLGQSQRTT